MNTVPWNGLHFMVVAVETVVTDERSGESVTITDTCAARKGTVIYCTQKIFDAITKS